MNSQKLEQIIELAYLRAEKEFHEKVLSDTKNLESEYYIALATAKAVEKNVPALVKDMVLQVLSMILAEHDL